MIKVEVCCYKCGADFDAFSANPNDKLILPLQDEGGHIRKAICPECKADCGEVSVMLTIK